MWSSRVNRKGRTQVMYIVKLKDGPKRAKKKFLMILERVFKMVWWRGRKWNHIKKDIIEVELFSSSQNIDFPFIWRDSWSFSFYSSFFLSWVRPYPSIMCSIYWIPSTNSGLSKISSQNSNQWCGREWEGRRPSPLSWIGSHHKHKCERTLKLGVTPTSPTPPAYRWRCHHRPWSYDL
jgi:hypothetical protein